MSIPQGEDLRQVLSGLPKQSPLDIVVMDPDLRIVWVNATLSDHCGTPGGLWVGRKLDQMLPGLDSDKIEGMLRHVLATGERVVDVEYHGPFLRYAKGPRVWSCSGFRLERPEVGFVGVALIASDVTERSRDRERLALLNEASERIGSTLDIFRTAEETLDVLVPRLGDGATMNLLSHVLDGGPQPRFEDGSDDLRMHLAAVRWLTGKPVPEPIRVGSVSYLDGSSLYYRWLSEGRTLFEPRLSDTSPEFREMHRSEFFGPRLEAVKKHGGHSIMILPVAARGVILGTVVMFRMRQPAFTEQEVALAQDVLARSGICLDNARVYTRERATALELQRSMLPQTIVETPGIDLAYRYEPANMAAEIGGDWFDVVRQPNGRVALIVGDVTGHDIHAASLMGQIRTVTRTLATLGLSPVEVLTWLDAMISEMGAEAGATCVYAAFDPDTRRCVIARAGHPPPALVLPAGTVDFLDLPTGLPLGVGGAAFESVEFVLDPGSVLVFYTDGLIESRDTGIDTGLDKLAQELAAGSVIPFTPQCASNLINRLVADPADDIAVLVARIAAGPR